MKTTRIDLIALNGGDGAHYKYEEVADKIIDMINDYLDPYMMLPERRKIDVTKILVENFPDA